MVPNIPENPPGRSTPKRGCKPFFEQALYQERFFTIERMFGWAYDLCFIIRIHHPGIQQLPEAC